MSSAVPLVRKSTMLWKRKREGISTDQREATGQEDWNACLDAIEEFLGEHSWVTEEDDPKEIFCDGCGASLSKKLKSLRKQGPSRTER